MPPRKAPQKPAATITRDGLSFLPVTDADKANIRVYMKNERGWPHELRAMQIEAAIAQVEGRDVLVHAPTGMGKTAIVAAPHAFPQIKGRVTIFISPLIALQEEMVTTFWEEFKLTAIAVNSTRRRSLRTIMKDICEGKYAVVLISPEMLQTRRFIDGVLRNQEFGLRFLSLVVDEAHTVSHWGAQFRKKYASLGMVRAFMRPGTSVVALSASLTPRVRRDVLHKLRFGTKFINIDLGNNRPNVSIVVRACHRMLTSFADLDFVIPTDVRTATDIPATFVYADNKEDGAAIVDHLRDLLPEDMRTLGFVRPFNASLSHDYRKDALKHFKAGNIRVLVCTDAAGMGCNLPNIEVVVQWKLPEKLSMFVQRAGRAARRPDMTGLAVLLVEPSAYSELPDAAPAEPSAPRSTPKKTKRGGRGKKSGGKPRGPKGWAKDHGRSRGEVTTPAKNKIDRNIKLLVSELAEDEGLIVLVQTGDCRRRVVAEAFDSADKSSTVPCCDLCCPALLDRMLPGSGPKRKPRKAKRDKQKKPASDVIDALRSWRLRTWQEDFGNQFFTERAILSDELIEALALLPELDDERALRSELKEWLFASKYSKSLWRVLAHVYDERPQQPAVQTKRKRADSTSEPTSAAVQPAQQRPSAANGQRVPDGARTTTAGTATPSGPPTAAAASVPGSSSAPAKRRRTDGAAATSGSTHEPATAGVQPRQPAPPPLPAAGPAPAGHMVPQPQPIKLKRGKTLPPALEHLQPPPEPQGPYYDPSRLVVGSDGRHYFYTIDNKWFLVQPLQQVPTNQQAPAHQQTGA